MHGSNIYIQKTYHYAIIRRCSESGCKLATGKSTGKYIILKGECLFKEKKACDCIFICLRGEKLIIGIIELKSGTTHVSEVEEKLYNCSEFVMSLINEVYSIGVSLDYEIIHVVLSKNLSSSEFMMIKSKKINLRGRKYNIIPQKCNTSFSEIIKKFLL